MEKWLKNRDYLWWFKLVSGNPHEGNCRFVQRHLNLFVFTSCSDGWSLAWSITRAPLSCWWLAWLRNVTAWVDYCSFVLEFPSDSFVFFKSRCRSNLFFFSEFPRNGEGSVSDLVFGHEAFSFFHCDIFRQVGWKIFSQFFTGIV